MYRYEAVETFWASFYALSPDQKVLVRAAWKIFKIDPFDSRLRTHKIHRLSALRKATIWSAVIDGDIRVIFFINGNVVTTLDVGTHDVYK